MNETERARIDHARSAERLIAVTADVHGIVTDIVSVAYVTRPAGTETRVIMGARGFAAADGATGLELLRNGLVHLSNEAP